MIMIIIVNICYYGGAITKYTARPPYSVKSRNDDDDDDDGYYYYINNIITGLSMNQISVIQLTVNYVNHWAMYGLCVTKTKLN